jgi:hypothetical protein
MLFDPNPREGAHGAQWSYISLSQNIHVGVTKFWGGCLVIFNHTAPNRNVLYFVDEKNGITQKSWSGYGLFFRSIKYANEHERDHWTLTFNLWWPMILFAAASIVFFMIAYVLKQRIHPSSPGRDEDPRV